MNIDDLLAELGSQMGLDNLKLDENNACRLVFDQKYAVDIESTEGGKIVHMYGVVGQVPPDNKVAFMEMLLEANLFGKGAGGAAFALDSSYSDVYMCRAFAMDSTDYQDFVNALETFVNHLESWSENIEKGITMHDTGSSSQSSQDTPKMGSGFIKA